MNRSILLPTDFSENAWSAILYAIRLYHHKPCTFYLFHTWAFINSDARTYITTSHINELKKEAAQELETLKEKVEIESSNTKHEFKTIFSANDFLSSIASTIEKHHIDLIIMGTKGSSGVGRILFGSNTVSLINRIQSCPILAIPDGFEFVTPKHLAFPTDYNRFYDDELKHLKHFSDLYASKIKVLHVHTRQDHDLSEKQNYNLAMLKAYLEEYPHSFHWAKGDDKKEIAINNFIDEFDIDILIMINYKHNFIENMMKEPIIKKIGFHPKVPFLVIPSLG
ncbi:universal stress protein [uncultured Polaribacter sp.]|uniref:universal stress protein n=1 Tax=uncultured Polaribacter sp. TaxID=174711 RepID=UPI0026103CB3|nr:universal stress protein [uncultured Polaribacter sp.]